MNPPEHLKSDLIQLLPRLQRYARSLTLTSSDADELLQSTCERVLLKWQQFRPGTEFDRWAFTIMSSIRSNYLRAGAKRNGSGLVDAETTLVANENESPERRRYLDEVVNRVLELPIAQKQTLILVYVEGFTYKETAEILSVPIGTVMSRIARARATLAGQLTVTGFKRVKPYNSDEIGVVKL